MYASASYQKPFCLRLRIDATYASRSGVAGEGIGR